MSPRKPIDLKTMVRRLSLPGGAGRTFTSRGYQWTKRGGYADSTFKKVYAGIKTMGFKPADHDNFNSPDGNVCGSGSVYVKGPWVLDIHSSYGCTKSDNHFRITLVQKV